ncbi:5-(carboxyamino)imidazole ribonucleotide mutase [Brachyspira pilosicoli]|uniref:N5-carboxyaminoimidazole ribonucleotide mutase n=3 Tax=Brachyspira pilosicoli TaxID=52584 RepID=A0A3B6VMU7_BRAPL|nr:MULTISPECIES: 5-(carboxyamino)imidazole ribonucleotide mutase [Brachyspira]AGA67068.1 phosphoribosylaminoimidazole carboxylase catalytic subunit [Brachyspira pilosicoli P43/6/78]MBW5383076.1 5-(carboxyamino)imidazole ribonucleotide mutase [Brachyspira pilosicoli]PLV55410.1 N5-carboxyaminoimidazole ribonucleotide mutase [Brachyspira pilosicoli SP16]WIH80865.1 5-(carboxyamino)imidazole ribonucleotide mutase [Brachyspira pilosicoli]WIH85305.1 5-(carboxyamino)imidazole ribonucleotide mutase [Br
MKVAIIFGSRSDTDKMKNAALCLKEFGIEYKAFVLSAHRVPEHLEKTIKDIENQNFEVIIAGAGLAAHLPGVIASKTILPVIGVPISASVLDGMDALLSIVQMPKPITVATVGINNSYNAGMLAVEMLSLKYESVRNKLIEYRKKMKEDFISDNEKPIDFGI